MADEHRTEDHNMQCVKPPLLQEVLAGSFQQAYDIGAEFSGIQALHTTSYKVLGQMQGGTLCLKHLKMQEAALWKYPFTASHCEEWCCGAAALTVPTGSHAT